MTRPRSVIRSFVRAVAPSLTATFAPRLASGLALALGLTVALPAALPSAGAQRLDPAPEAASGFRTLHAVSARRAMVATAHPLASRAAQAVLARGGHAIDAVVAAQWVLGLVEPQSSGLGGGAFLVTWQRRTGALRAWDGRETAPAAARPDLFIGADGRPLAFRDAVIGGRSVGTPGAVRMLDMAHRALGHLDWGSLAAPAIALARDGFPVGPRLATLIAGDDGLDDDPAAQAYFDHWPAGHRLRNPEYAATLTRIARERSDALHRGPIAAAIVAKVRQHPRNPGGLAEQDLAGYRPIEREPLCGPWRRWVVCGMPPPSSGTLAVLQMLGILEASGGATLVSRDEHGRPVLSLAGVHRFAEAGRLAFADRDRYVADPDFVPWPRGLLDPAYLRDRAARIGGLSIVKAPPGRPPSAALPAPASAERPAAPAPVLAGTGVFTYPETGTTHVSVVDADGNAAALTSTIEAGFGSRQWVAGFLLNNQLTDFAFSPSPAPDRSLPDRSASDRSAADPPVAVANRVEPGKRPRSSMAPLLIFEHDPTAPGGRGPLVMVTGSPGGSAIINFVAKTVIATLGDGLDPQQAIDLPNIGSRNGPTELEAGRVAPPLIAALRARGHPVREMPMTSGIQSIVRRDGRWIGAADPRREGLVLGLE